MYYVYDTVRLAVVFTGLGIAGTIQSASNGNYAQAAFRGVTSVFGAFLYLRSTTRASNAEVPDFDAFSDPDQGFSGVWHSESGRIIVKPSSDQVPTPGGFLPRRVGHAEIAAELGGNPEHLFGFTLIKQADGRIRIEFFSRGVNGRNPSFPGNVVPEALQPVIAAAVQGASRKQIVIEP